MYSLLENIVTCWQPGPNGNPVKHGQATPVLLLIH